MKKILFTLIILLSLCGLSHAACTGSSPTWTTTPDYTSVDTCVTSATAGDKINVTAGNATWSSILTITKRVHLIGAGIGNTNITVNAGTGLGLIQYIPADSFSTDYFRLSGFTFDASATGYKVLYVTRRDMSQPTYIRIDNNRFIETATPKYAVFELYRRIRGVVHNNTFEGATHIDNYGCAALEWTTFSPLPGNEDNIFYEDNTFALVGTLTTGGGRYVYRYNTIDVSASPSGFYPLWDAHGNQSTSNYGNIIVEIYGNKIVGNKSMKILDHRGGKAFFYFNKSLNTSNPYGSVQDEITDSIMTPLTALDGTPYRPNTSYYFNNRYGASGTTLYNPKEGTDVDGIIAENQNWWNYTPTFDGTSGMGCGSLANRPGTCTAGVGYWATSQSCSTISDDHVGASPATPLSGTLYRCTATNTWTEYYTPYQYPHPLRSETDETSPTLVSASIDTTGETLTIVLSETATVNTNTGFSLDPSGADVTLTYVGVNNAILTYTISRAIQQSETVTLAYTEGENLITDTAGNELKTFGATEVTNNSTQDTPPLVTLAVTSTGASVQSSPAGINCGSTCSHDYDNGTVVTLTATCLANYQTAVWSGTGCGSSTTMSEARNCTATCSKIAADNKVGAGNPGQRVGAGNPAHKRY